jgi:tetratricopeptide (TPR) repeat protein
MITENTRVPHARETERQAIAALYATGYWLLSVDSPRAAVDVFRTMIVVAPADERGWLGLGQVHEQLDGPETAVRLYAVACRAAPTSSRCHVARARLLARLGRKDEALSELDSAQEIAEALHDQELIEVIEIDRGRLS